MIHLLMLLLIVAMMKVSHSFSTPALSLLVAHRTSSQKNTKFMISHQNPPIPLFMATDSDDTLLGEQISTSITSLSSSSSSSSARSLEEKMKSWEATEEEIKAATLGGIVPGTRIGAGTAGESAGRADAFDVGLYIAFPIMILSCLAVSFYYFCRVTMYWIQISCCANCSCLSRAWD
jgi:hypothetical protein